MTPHNAKTWWITLTLATYSSLSNTDLSQSTAVTHRLNARNADDSAILVSGKNISVVEKSLVRRFRPVFHLYGSAT